jgi:rod shape-determining protein MreB
MEKIIMLNILKKLMPPPSIALDLGTANTRIYTSEFGKITEEPSWVRYIAENKEQPVSDEYIAYINSRLVSTPLRGGVIVDIKSAITLLKPLVKQTRKWLMPPTTLACAPTDTSEKERKLLTEAVLHAGAANVAIIPEVWAAAIGAGIDVSLPRAQVLIDIGEGVTDMAVIRDGRLFSTSAVRIACSDLQKAVRTAVLSKYKVILAPVEAERLTHEISALAQQESSVSRPISVSGIDIVKRCRVHVEIHSGDIITALKPVIQKILKLIVESLQRLPENISCEIGESGICLTGGGACISGMDSLIASKTQLPVKIAPDPLHSVIHGAGQALNCWKNKECWWENVVWPKLAA